MTIFGGMMDYLAFNDRWFILYILLGQKKYLFAPRDR